MALTWYLFTSRRRAALAALGLLTALGSCSENSGHSANPNAVNAALRVNATAQSEWRHYLNGSDHSHHSPLQQINAQNVHTLEEAWRYNAGALGDGFLSEMQCNPLVIRGLLYCTTPKLNVFALNAASGERLWEFDSGFTADLNSPNANRGLSYWQDPEDSDNQRLLFTAGSFLYALNPLTGHAIQDFGNKGRIDLHTGLPTWAADSAVVATTPGTVFDDLLIMGSRVSEFSGAAPGHVRAFDVRSGALRWIFHTIPKPGEYGSDTWPADAFDRIGGANSWAGIAVDHDNELAFVPTGSPAFDFHGADRLGDNLFANSLVALNARTGERVWHYQFIRHDVWDRDLPSPPNLLDWLPEDADTAIPAVIQATKSGHLFVFNRLTGEPLVPITQQAVVGTALAGDKLAEWQPIPDFPAFAQQEFTPSSRKPDIEAAVKRRISSLKSHAAFRPPSLEGTILYPGIDGGAEWGGSAFDPDKNTLFINSNEVPYLLQMVELEGSRNSPEFAYLMMCAGCHGTDLRGDGVSVPSLLNLSERMSAWEAWRVISDGRGRMPSFSQTPAIGRAAVLYHLWSAEDKSTQIVEKKSGQTAVSGNGELINAGYQKLLDPENMPASEPPWGTLTAIDLTTASIRWRIPLGDYPEMLRQGVSGLGAENYGGPVVTAGNVVFIAATPDKMFRAFDSRNGELLWQTELPFAGFATPSTYSVDGVQYVVVAAGGGKLATQSGSEYLAFKLPTQNTSRPTLSNN